MVAALTISGLIVRNAKEPAANVVLSATGGQIVLQADEGILNDILRFITGKSVGRPGIAAKVCAVRDTGR